MYFGRFLDSVPCYWGLHKNGLCWVWASESTLKGAPFGTWRSPNKEEWVERPSWRELADHCHTETFGGGRCDIKTAEEKGNICFCRNKKDWCGSQHCDIMYVKSAGMKKYWFFITVMKNYMFILKHRNSS